MQKTVSSYLGLSNRFWLLGLQGWWLMSCGGFASSSGTVLPVYHMITRGTCSSSLLLYEPKLVFKDWFCKILFC